MPELTALDHLVLTVQDIAHSVRFYTALGMQPVTFQVADGSTRTALQFGDQKINLHPADAPFQPHAKTTVPGSADLCFLTETPLAHWALHLADQGIEIEDGPVPRTGARGPILSIYVRDPDGNLVEISTQS